MKIIDPTGNIDSPEDLPATDRQGRPAVWTVSRAAAFFDGINGNPFTQIEDDSELRDYWIMGHQFDC